MNKRGQWFIIASIIVAMVMAGLFRQYIPNIPEEPYQFNHFAKPGGFFDWSTHKAISTGMHAYTSQNGIPQSVMPPQGNATYMKGATDAIVPYLLNISDAWLDIQLFSYPSFELSWIFGTKYKVWVFNFADNDSVVYIKTDAGPYKEPITGSKKNITRAITMCDDTTKACFRKEIVYHRYEWFGNVTQEIDFKEKLPNVDINDIQTLVLQFHGYNYTAINLSSKRVNEFFMYYIARINESGNVYMWQESK